ncbi:hypothetical protein [Candidatus Rariloculus sp.]|uniref:hypothetical protein n=1 Tax=Candidatus Rariloculus sp. TaxID=3101265 RepID=UPI003D0A9A2E
MSSITFKRAADDEWRIYDHDGDCVGEVFLQADILNPGAHYYLVWLSEDPRGFVRVHDRSRVREVAQQRLDSHPYG